MPTLTETIEAQENQISQLQVQVAELMRLKSELFEQLPMLAATVEGQQKEISHLQDQIGELLRLKAESDKALQLWAGEIQDEKTKEAVLRWLVGDIRCFETPMDLDPPSFPGGIDPSHHQRRLAAIDEAAGEDSGDDDVYSPAPITRTLTCPPAPRKAERCVDDDDRSYGPRGPPKRAHFQEPLEASSV